MNHMSMTTKLILSCLGTFLAPVAMYYQGHAKPETVGDPHFWISAVVAGVMPLATYFIGLAQRAPWDAPSLPTKTVETKVVTTEPTPGDAAPTVRERTTRHDRGD
jgi:hypothetical protein